MLLKKLLMITYHFPPSAASGTFRLLGFTRHLPTYGWQPIVVAPPSLPWEPIDGQLAKQVPMDAIVESVPYPASAPRLLRALAQNAIWLPRAWSACQRVVTEHRPDAILTSGPPHCVHVLGHYLKRKTGLPWVADFRDPWISDGTDKRLNWAQNWTRRWEGTVFDRADLILANAPNATRLFQSIYPEAADRIVTLTNGFDPAEMPACPQRPRTDLVRLLHAGEIYAGRDPRPLFEALSQMNAAPYRLHILGRNDTNLTELLNERGWAGFVQVDGQCGYQQSLDEMERADILVLFDSPGRTVGVPAKLYEYFRAGRPILALAEEHGDVANILRASGVPHRIAPPRDTARIRQALHELSQQLDADDDTNPELLRRFTRTDLTQSLAHRLDTLIDPCGSEYLAPGLRVPQEVEA